MDPGTSGSCKPCSKDTRYFGYILDDTLVLIRYNQEHMSMLPDRLFLGIDYLVHTVMGYKGCDAQVLGK